MRRLPAGLIALFVAASTFATAQSPASPPNPQIDADGFAKDVAAAGSLRATRRLSEEEFIRMAKEPGTVVLDARSDRLFRMRHVKGAVNLGFPEFTAETLAAWEKGALLLASFYALGTFVACLAATALGRWVGLALLAPA